MERVYREWGWWRVLASYDNSCKIKELVVNPKARLSWQRHEFRSEVWFVRKGAATNAVQIAQYLITKKL